MKQKLTALLLACLLLGACTGCASVFRDEYYYEEPITGDFGTFSGDATEIRNYSMLKTALTDMISRHEEQGEFRLNSYVGSPSEDLAAACFEIKSNNPLGAYAVETISYDTSYVVSYYMANIYISYKRTAAEVADIVYAGSIAELDDCVRQALEGFRPGTVVRLYSAAMDEQHIRRLVTQCYYEDPVARITEPEVAVTTYPLEGANRIYDVRFSYDVTQAENLSLSLALSSQLHSAAAELTETEPLYLALESAAYLSAACTDAAPEGGHPGTAYGAVMEHFSDSRGMALAYKAFCDRLNIPCQVVEGSVRTMGVEPHFWNIITLDGDCYHVDVSAFAEDPAAAFLLSDDTRWGTYIWETEAYPVCAGALTYADAARLEPEHVEETEDAPAEPGETPPEELPPETEPPVEEENGEESEKSA